ncbi:MAG: DUF2029 domain-containing protein [Candidatus Eremiobacteraeota bacterium]|nr:DUF2029 domain-containing protein [Candidatus Eremiobacteraeota bacterium]
MRDFESYYAAGATWDEGTDPYSTAIWRVERTIPGVNLSRLEILPFVGPPLGLPLWGALARLPYPQAAATWATVLATLLALSLALIWRFSRGRFNLLATLGLIVLALSFGPITSDLALGQVALAAFACVLLSVALTLAERTRLQDRLGAIVAAVLAALQPNIALILIARVGRRPMVAIYAIALAIFVTLCTLFGGWNALPAYLHLLMEHGAAERFSLIQITPASIAYGFGLSPRIAFSIGVIAALIGIAVWMCARLSLRRRAGSYENARRNGTIPMLGLSCALLPFAVGFFHEHDLLILMLPALYCCTHLRDRVWQLAAFATLLVAIDWLGLAQRPDGALQSGLLALSALCAYGSLARARVRALALPAVAILLMIVCGAIAQTHPAPIWPDTLHLPTSLLTTAPLSQIWQQEQRSSGLLAPNAFWASLRLLSLLGCALLAYCTVLAAKHEHPSASRLSTRDRGRGLFALVNNVAVAVRVITESHVTDRRLHRIGYLGAVRANLCDRCSGVADDKHHAARITLAVPKPEVPAVR